MMITYLEAFFLICFSILLVLLHLFVVLFMSARDNIFMVIIDMLFDMYETLVSKNYFLTTFVSNKCDIVFSLFSFLFYNNLQVRIIFDGQFVSVKTNFSNHSFLITHLCLLLLFVTLCLM